MTQNSLSDMNGQQELNDALQRVARPSDNYYDEILNHVLVAFQIYHLNDVLGMNAQKQFTSEHISASWEEKHPDKKPLEPRVYGAVIKQLQKEGKIRHVGYTKATNKQAHCRPISVWEVV